MTAHRKPPLRPREHLVCRWCGLPIQPKLKKNGEPRATQASFHEACSFAYRAARNPVILYNSLVVRDGEKCGCCGEATKRWWPERGVKGSIDSIGTMYYPDNPPGAVFVDYTPIEFRIVLEVDHYIPLWKVAHLPDDRRRWYFTIENLWLMQPQCHTKKTAKEAAERAHFNRLSSDKPKKPKRRWPSRKIHSRPMRAQQ